MTLNFPEWKHQARENLSNWQVRVKDKLNTSVYTVIATAALLPLVRSVKEGNPSALSVLSSITSGIGVNLLANLIQKIADENDLVRQLEMLSEDDPIYKELDLVLEKLDMLKVAYDSLPEDERPWFLRTLRNELAHKGHLDSFSALITTERNITAQEHEKEEILQSLKTKNINGEVSTYFTQSEPTMIALAPNKLVTYLTVTMLTTIIISLFSVIGYFVTATGFAHQFIPLIASAISITLGLATILFIAKLLYSRQNNERQLAIEKLYETEVTFFQAIETNLANLFVEEKK